MRLKRGTIVVDIMPAIQPGLNRIDFFALVQNQIETSSNKLMAEANA